MPLPIKKVQLTVKDGNQYVDGDLLFNIDAEAWARGTRAGQPVSSTDETYHNNAKYYVDSSVDAINDAKTTGLSAINSVATTGLNSVNSAATSGVSSVNAAATNAIANFPATAEVCDSLIGNFAPAYVANQAYSIGDYVTYQYQLYKCKVPIEKNEDSTFVSDHWAAISTGNDLTSLRNAFNATLNPDILQPTINERTYIDNNDGKRKSSAGAYCTSSVLNGYGYRAAVILDSNIYVYKINYYNSDYNLSSGAGYANLYTNYRTGLTYLSNAALYFAITFCRVDQAVLTNEDYTAILAALSCYKPTDSTFTKAGAAADAKTVGTIVDDNAVDITKNIPDTSSTQYGTTLAFQRDGEWTKTGSASQTKILTFVSASNSEKYGFIAGKSYYVDFTSSARSESTYDSIELLFYKNINGEMNTNAIATFNGRCKRFGIVTMPSLEDGFTGITIRLRTKTNAPTNASGTIKIYTAFPNQILSTAVKSLTRHSIAFFGDSIMLGANGNDEITYRNLPYIIAHNLSANYYNYGVSSAGYVTLGTGNVNAYDIISSTNLSSFDTIVICFGVNDGFKPIGTYDSTNETECLGQFNKIIAYLGTNYPSIRIIVVAPFNGRNVGTFPKYWYGTVPSTAYSRGTLSDTLKQACEYYNIPYIEQKDGPINGYSINTLIGMDGVHPSQAGYDALGAWLSGEIARLIC